MKQNPISYTLTHDEIVAIFKRWYDVNAKFGADKEGTAEQSAEYFVTLAQILSTESK